VVVCLVQGANDLHMAYGPADAIATTLALSSLKSTLAIIQVVLENRLFNRCLSASISDTYCR